MDFDTWLQIGISRDWCGPPVCLTHDGIPSSEAEDNEEYDGEEPCLHAVRLYTDANHRAAVEANHSPSVWRNTNRN